MSKTFCVLPWVHAATLPDGNMQLCCIANGVSGINLNQNTLADYWNCDSVKMARRQMLAGEEVAACRQCYREEQQGHRSYRVSMNQIWQRNYGEEAIQNLLRSTTEDGALETTALQSIDLRLGNTCNMQCVMCQSRESSRWLPAARKLSEICQDEGLKREFTLQSQLDARQFEWYRNPAFWSNLEMLLPFIREITLAGGEPFLIKEQFEFLKACCHLGHAGHIRLRYHTNGTIFPEEMKHDWEQFERVHFMISIDGIGAVANYVRYPSHWSEIEDNIRQFDVLGPKTIINFNFTAHALTIGRLPEVMEWAERLSLRNRKHFAHLQDFVTPALVHEPEYQSVRVLPAALKLAITGKIRDYVSTRLAGQEVDKLEGVVAFMNSEDHTSMMPRLMEYTRMLDATRGTDFKETFPELIEYWNGAIFRVGAARSSD